MDRDWTASFSVRFLNGTCIIFLDKKYNIANSSCHFGSYGSIWTGPYTAIWPSVPWTIWYALHFRFVFGIVWHVRIILQLSLVLYFRFVLHFRLNCVTLIGLYYIQGLCYILWFYYILVLCYIWGLFYMCILDLYNSYIYVLHVRLV